jgi:hypothetical protein
MRCRLLSKALFVLAMVSPALAEDRKPSASYWHLWTGKDGMSHLSECVMSDFVQQTANPQWQIKQPGSAKIIFAYDPKGDWHENPLVQWVVPLQGQFFIKAQDGSQVTLPPGSLYLGEDLNTSADAQGHKGHLSGKKGDEPLVLMIMQLDVQPTVDEPCHAK